MNERILELAENYLVHERFGLYGESIEEDYYEFYPEDLEKFAKLIVRECVDFLKDTLDDHFAAEQLEEHFGVE